MRGADRRAVISDRLLRRWVPPGLFVVLLTVHLVTVSKIAAPQLHVDEAGYLTIARHLAIGTPVPNQQYFPGYSVLLTPVFWLVRDPVIAYKAVLVINAALLAGVGPLAWWFTQLVTERRISPRLATAVALGVGLYPSFFVHAGIAWAEALIVPGFIALACFFVLMMRSGAAWWWLAASSLAVYLVIANPRVVPVVPALVAAVLMSRPRGPGSFWRLSAFGTGLAVTAVVGVFLVRAVDLDPVGPVPHLDVRGAHSAARIVTTALDPTNAPKIGLVFAGQGFYIAVASLGVIVLGLIAATAATKRVVTRRGLAEGNDLTLAFLCMSFVGVWILSAVFMSSAVFEIGWEPVADRYEYLIYGRYIEGVAAPLMVIGLLVLARVWRRRWSFPTAAVVVAGTISAGAVLAFGAQGRRLPVVGAYWQNIHAIRPYVFWLGGRRPLLLGVAVVVVSLTGWMLARRWPVPTIAGLALWFAFVGLHGVYGYLVPDSRLRANERVVADAVTLVGQRFGLSLRCVAVDGTLPRRWHEFNYWYFLPGIRLERIDLGRDRPCSPLLIGPKRGVDSIVAGARPIAFETRAESALWVLPGPLSARLTRAGWTPRRPPIRASEELNPR